jgi:large subunit ribosomal protein L22
VTTHVKATSRYVRVAPNKARQVVAHIRGRRIDDARRMLLLSPKAISEQILKTLNSAVANAENNHDLDAEDLYVTSVIINEGPQLKRFQPRAMGRAYRIRKRTSHITISVSTENAPPPRVNRNRPARPAAVVAEAPAPEPVEEAKKPSRRRKAAAPAAKDAPVETTDETTTVEEAPVDSPDADAADAAADTADETTADTADDSADAATETDDDAADADTKE